ncbi:MAG: hypothetical protein IJS75_03700 [Bacteroidales bacterium]|nr:hypothetical protein [Bacteroidales bacterium]
MSRTSLRLCLLGALALAAFVSCNKEAREGNPNYNPNTNEVNTKFVFNLSSLAKTKQAGTNVQAGGTNFRGVSKASLMTLVSSNASGYVKDGILANDHVMDRLYDLSSVMTSSAGTRVLEMSLPLRTDVMLFYGKSPTVAYSYDAENKIGSYDQYGHLDVFDIKNEANASNIQLGKRLSEDENETWNNANFRGAEKLLGGILTLVMNSTLSEDYVSHGSINADESEGDNKYGFSLNGTKLTLAEGGYPVIAWADYNSASGKSPVDGTDLHPMEQKLQYLYKQMTTIRANELRAASGEAVIKIVQDLWSVINSVRCAAPTCEAEAVAKYFAAQVHKRLAKYFSYSTLPTDGSAVSGVGFLGITEIINKFENETTYDGSPSVRYNLWPNTTKANAEKPTAAELAALRAITSGKPLTDFPLAFHIPRGAAYMAYDEEGKCFYYPQDFNVSGMGGNTDNSTYNAENYYYPAELVYFGNSPIRVSDKEHKGGYPTSGWELDASWGTPTFEAGEWNGSSVLSTTRSVAMKYNINYGVAMLKTMVKYGAPTIQDNRAAVLKLDDENSTEGNQTIVVDENSFKLTGVIIGGQPQNIGWNCLPIKAPNGTKETVTYGFIYDRDIASMDIPGSTASASSPNYTVVFDNYRSGKANGEQDIVYVALEFQNNTQKDIYGNANIIKNGGYFYLIGALNPNLDATDPDNHMTAVTWPTTGSYVPPFNANGTRSNITRVFIQDFVTSATFTFGVNSLASAYLTVPDLRASSLTLGLSVDLNWQQGLVYDDVPLGGVSQ